MENEILSIAQRLQKNGQVILFEDETSKWRLTPNELKIHRDYGFTRNGIVKLCHGIELELGREFSVFEEAVHALDKGVQTKIISDVCLNQNVEISIQNHEQEKDQILGVVSVVRGLIAGFAIHPPITQNLEQAKNLGITSLAHASFGVDNTSTMSDLLISQVRTLMVQEGLLIPEKKIRYKIQKTRMQVAFYLYPPEYCYGILHLYSKYKGGDVVYLSAIGLPEPARDAILYGKAVDSAGYMKSSLGRLPDLSLSPQEKRENLRKRLEEKNKFGRDRKDAPTP